MSEQPLDALAPKEEEADVHFEPVIKLTQTVNTKTHEEDEDTIFKMRAKLFRFEMSTAEWKERGTGDVKLLEHKVTKKIRLVMRRDKTLKVCANHSITLEMNLQPNIGSDRSWVWKVAADYAEAQPTSETFAIRFANSDNAGQFKTAFDAAKDTNADVSKAQAAAVETSTEEPAKPAKPEEEPEKPAEGEPAPDAADKEQGETTEAKEETPKD